MDVITLLADGLDSLVTGAVSKCWKKEIDVETLVTVLGGKGDISVWQAHVGLFFSELPIDAAVSFILKYNLRGSGLRLSYQSYLHWGGDPNPDLEEWIYG